MLWIWRAPTFFDRALVSEWQHAAQHLSLMFSALLFWWSINLASSQGQRHGVAALLLTSLHSGLLGALMAFADSPWYAQYAALGLSGTAGLTPLEDQQIAVAGFSTPDRTSAHTVYVSNRRPTSCTFSTARSPSTSATSP